MDKELVKRLARRFLRAFCAGATAMMMTILPFQGDNWGDVHMWLGSLVLAGVVGGVSGVIMTADKAFRDLRG